MKYVLPERYTIEEVDKAGEILVGRMDCDEQQRQEAVKIFSNWRASHAYPLNIIARNLQRVSKQIHSEAIGVQRLKREESIINKLRRFTRLPLSQIQDIGGCRIVMPNVSLARQLSMEYVSRNKKHKRVKRLEKNYINEPKSDGYRSIHLVYKYSSVNKVGQVYNDRKIEIQIRSKLQHLWATALETVDLFTTQQMKFGGGQDKWKYFFKLIGSAFAIIEETPIVEGTPLDKTELYEEIKRMTMELKVIEKMTAWRASVDRLKAEKDSLFLLKLDTLKHQVTFQIFKSDNKGIESATVAYSLEEQQNRDNKHVDVVLIRAQSISDLLYGYKNYFADTEDFIKQLQLLINS